MGCSICLLFINMYMGWKKESISLTFTIFCPILVITIVYPKKRVLIANQLTDILNISGFYEYVELLKTNHVSKSISINTSPKIPNTITKVIEFAKKAQTKWKNVQKMKKINIFQKMVEYLEENKLKLRYFLNCHLWTICKENRKKMLSDIRLSELLTW